MNAARIIEDARLEEELANAEKFEAALRDAVQWMPDNYGFPVVLRDLHACSAVDVYALRRRLGLNPAPTERAGGTG